MPITVIAAVIERDGKILLLRRAPGQKLAGKWEFPGGKAELGESDGDCLERELREELGINGYTGAHVRDSAYSYAFMDIVLRAYRFTWTSGVMRLLVHDRAIWLPPRELPDADLSPADIPVARFLAEEAPDAAENRQG
jgi:8-oxo-dGTP diphosphatase